MKKQITKLSLNKRTITNLSSIKMDQLIGGGATKGANCNTKKCPDTNDTCYCTGYCSAGCTCTCQGGACITF